MADDATDQQNPNTEGQPGSNDSGDRKTTSLEDLQAFLAEQKLEPGQFKGRLEALKDWERKAKSGASENKKLLAELEEARKAGMSADEKEREKLRSEAHAAGLAEAASIYGSQMVKGEFKAMLAGRGLSTEQIAVLAEDLPVEKYMSGQTVDSTKLAAYVDAGWPKKETEQTAGTQPLGFGPAAFGAGHRSPTAPTPGAAGMAEIERRFGKKTSAA